MKKKDATMLKWLHITQGISGATRWSADCHHHWICYHFDSEQL